ncbi:glycosyltransferase family protein [Sinorhizobium meliloti]|nr:hypothetical protein [Sinorhizobium meliloti]
MRVFSPDNLSEARRAVLCLPERCDAALHMPPYTLHATHLPESCWSGMKNNAVSILLGATAAEAEEVPPAAAATAATTPAIVRRRARVGRSDVLFVSANGIGQGHLTRQLAVARRLGGEHSAAFLTMSYSASVVQSMGFAVHFLPHHHLTGEDPVAWNARLGEEIELLLDERGSETLVYDVNFVFDGVIDVLRKRCDLKSIWIRRAMWPEHHAPYLGASVHFQTIIEPGEYAQAYETGPTRLEREKVKEVPPVLLLDPGERLERQAARAALGLPEDRTIVVLDIARASNLALTRRHREIDALLTGRGDVHVVELSSALAASPEPAGQRLGRSRFTAYPAYKFSNAWDAAIVRASYNTFHESIAGAIPTLFVPDESEDMDRQVDRARWARDRGVGLLSRLEASHGELQKAVDTVLDAQARNRLAAACQDYVLARGGWHNGAVTIADAITSSKHG